MFFTPTAVFSANLLSLLAQIAFPAQVRSSPRSQLLHILQSLSSCSHRLGPELPLCGIWSTCHSHCPILRKMALDSFSRVNAGYVVWDPSPLWPQQVGLGIRTSPGKPSIGWTWGGGMSFTEVSLVVRFCSQAYSILDSQLVGPIMEFQKWDDSQKSGCKKGETKVKEGAGDMPASEMMGMIQFCSYAETSRQANPPPFCKAWLSPCWGGFLSLPCLPSLPEPGFVPAQSL